MTRVYRTDPQGGTTTPHGDSAADEPKATAEEQPDEKDTDEEKEEPDASAE
jgi:hypothetical protein